MSQQWQHYLKCIAEKRCPNLEGVYICCRMSAMHFLTHVCTVRDDALFNVGNYVTCSAVSLVIYLTSFAEYTLSTYRA